LIILGLTGSIGMGKSTVANMFVELGVPVYDADAAVHRLYAKGGAAVAPVEAAFPGVTVAGAIDRQRLSARVVGDAAAMKRLEAIVHPLVSESRNAFLQKAEAEGAPLVVLDIPLLFETGGQNRVEKTVVVSAPAEAQHDRVLARPEMTKEKFHAILEKQTPDAEKRRLADYVIDTGGSLEETRAQVRALVESLTQPTKDEPRH
jgi:dephospho-CoA kinase